MSRSTRWGFVTLVALVSLLPVHAGNSSNEVTLALELSRQTDPQQGSATVIMDNLDQGLRGISVDLRVPASWGVTSVQAVGARDVLNVFHHRNGEMLRVMLVSASGAVMPAGRGPVFEVRLERQDAKSVQPGIALIGADAADEQGDPLTVRVVGPGGLKDPKPGFGRRR